MEEFPILKEQSTSMKKVLQYIIFGSLAVMGCSCAAGYHPIKPLSTNFNQASQVLEDSTIKINYRYNVLKEARNRRYADNERYSGVSLLAVRIENRSDDTLFFPEDIQILSGLDTVYMLSMQETHAALQQTYFQEEGFIQLGYSWEDVLLSLGVELINISIEVGANKEFAKELDNHYLLPSYVEPGFYTIGLLGLDVPKGTPLRFIYTRPIGN